MRDVDVFMVFDWYVGLVVLWVDINLFIDVVDVVDGFMRYRVCNDECFIIVFEGIFYDFSDEGFLFVFDVRDIEFFVLN